MPVPNICSKIIHETKNKIKYKQTLQLKWNATLQFTSPVKWNRMHLEASKHFVQETYWKTESESLFKLKLHNSLWIMLGTHVKEMIKLIFYLFIDLWWFMHNY